MPEKFDWSKAVTGKPSKNNNSFDWSKAITNKKTVDQSPSTNRLNAINKKTSPETTKNQAQSLEDSISSIVNTIIDSNNQSIKTTQEAMDQRLREGFPEELVSNFRERIKRLSEKNEKLLEYIKNNPNDENLEKLREIL